ncbi:c-type cytochrome [Ramlibacter tataouinensis]|uniref:Cytochrome c-like protein n=1 Tax=Ramlibacter tataouinensis (strain ATCC BAA-407 / DSM 14655 / LMG 21543 / TTB310) TaxID=365046 RepID=F5Y3I6_RAMTT|nr:c-type cytochrome [Ramlibacter tataouinensis]AEG92460.1 cytochrome c-like protein [Ramlibacter tataouinensis TTB310]
MLHQLIAAALMAGLPALACAQQAQAFHLQGLAATCASCHGTHGRAAEGSPLPSLAGMPRDRMVAQLKAFKAGTQPATIMHQLAKGYSDAQIEQLAGYFAAQKR